MDELAPRKEPNELVPLGWRQLRPDVFALLHARAGAPGWSSSDGAELGWRRESSFTGGGGDRVMEHEWHENCGRSPTIDGALQHAELKQISAVCGAGRRVQLGWCGQRLGCYDRCKM